MSTCGRCGQLLFGTGACLACGGIGVREVDSIGGLARRQPELDEVLSCARGLKEQMSLASFSIGRSMELSLGIDAASRSAMALENQMFLDVRSAFHTAIDDMVAPSRAIAEQLRADSRIIGDRLRAALDEIASSTALARFGPSLDELGLMAGHAGERWQLAIEEMDLSYSFTSLSTLKNAIDFGPFSEATLAAIHDQLGDWSGASLAMQTLDMADRLALYYDRGLDRRLVPVPPDVFNRVLRATEICDPRPPSAIPAYSLPPLDEEYAADEATEMDEAGRRLRTLETHLRAFIDRLMIEAFGSGWFRRRVPGDVLEKARQCRNERETHGSPRRELLLYVDFPDYAKIICRADNWPVFAPYFRRKTSVEETFVRLNPLRADIAHSRSFSSEDWLFFHAESLRLFRAMNLPPTGEPDPEE